MAEENQTGKSKQKMTSILMPKSCLCSRGFCGGKVF
jgi:hypothetical protein